MLVIKGQKRGEKPLSNRIVQVQSSKASRRWWEPQGYEPGALSHAECAEHKQEELQKPDHHAEVQGKADTV